MKKLAFLSALCGLSLVSFASVTHADTDRITGFTAQIVGNDSQIEFNWDAFPGINDLDDVEGYGLMWDGNLYDISATEYATVELGTSTRSHTIRGIEKKGQDPFYASVFTWHERNGVDYLRNGAKPIKITLDRYGVLTTVVQDRTLSDAPVPTAVSSGSSAGTAPEIVFGNIVKQKFKPHSVAFSWSAQRELGNNFDHILFTLSEKEDMTSPIHTFEVAPGNQSVRMLGLDVSSKYYVQGEYIIDGDAYGESDVFTVQTRSAYTKEQEEQNDFLVLNGIITENTDMTTKVGTTTSSTSTTTTSSSSATPKTIVSLKARIAALKKELVQLEKELKVLDPSAVRTTLRTSIRRTSLDASAFKKRTPRYSL